MQRQEWNGDLAVAEAEVINFDLDELPMRRISQVTRFKAE